MNTSPEHELPDDVNRWPSDPAALFGVTKDVSRRDLKRAYSRLIRRFKPEHAPEQFRRLREAYEQLDRELEWRDSLANHLAQQRNRDDDGDMAGEEDSERMARPESSMGAENNGAGTTSFTGQRSEPDDRSDSELDAASDATTEPKTSFNEVDQLWQQALDGGDLKTIYSQLVQLAVRQPPSETGFARLYWLLTIHPEFDPDRDPIAWLVEGLHKHGLNGRMLPMFSIDIRRREGQVPLAIDADLLEGNYTGNRLADLVQVRWFAARSLSRFDVIAEDIERLRGQFLDEPDEWQRLLCGAVRQLVMIRSERADSLLAAVRKELTSTPADVSSNWLWDSLEATISLHEAWSDGSQRLLTANRVTFTDDTLLTLSRLATLVERTWERSPLQARSELMTMCVDLTADWRTSLSELTSITRVSRPLVGRLLELLYEQQSEFGSDDHYKITPAVEQELYRFVRGDLWQNIESTDAAVLRFCLHEAVTPQDVATVIEQYCDQLPDACVRLAESLRYHLPLMCLVEAQRMLW